MAHEALDPDFRNLIDEHAPVRQEGSGFTFTEGPIWHPVDHYLLFSDMPGDVRRRLVRAGVREIMNPSHKGNGMTYDTNLNLLVCEHATSSVARFSPDGRREVLASHYEGRELNSPNDIVVKSDGSIWFTDPWYGRMPGYGVERPRELGWQGVFRLPPGHKPGDEPELVVDRYLFTMPNGLCFCPDESKLYINDTEQANIRVFDVEGSKLVNGRVFAAGIRDSLKPGVPDGMKCDAEGNIWVTAPGGLWVYDSSGKLIGKVSIPELPANLHWGGRGLAHALCGRLHQRLFRAGEDRPQERTFHAGAKIFLRSRKHDRRRNHVRGWRGTTPGCLSLCADHPRHAERRGYGRWRLCRIRKPSTLQGAGCHRQRGKTRRPMPGDGCSGDPRPFPRTSGRTRIDAERAIVRGSGGRNGPCARDLGRSCGR